jgi:hypothetical protein
MEDLLKPRGNNNRNPKKSSPKFLGPNSRNMILDSPTGIDATINLTNSDTMIPPLEASRPKKTVKPFIEELN